MQTVSASYYNKARVGEIENKWHMDWNKKKKKNTNLAFTVAAS